MSARTVVRLEVAGMHDEPENSLRLQELITAAEHGDDLSVTWVQIAGCHRRVRTTRSTRIYVPLGGVLTIQVGDDPPVAISVGDVARVPRGTFYGLEGTGTYLVINAPAFAEGDDEYEEVSSEA